MFLRTALCKTSKLLQEAANRHSRSVLMKWSDVQHIAVPRISQCTLTGTLCARTSQVLRFKLLRQRVARSASQLHRSSRVSSLNAKSYLLAGE